MTRKRLVTLISWLITAVALYIVFSDLDWSTLLQHIGDIQLSWVVATMLLGVCSYFLRSARWIILFPERTLTFANSYRVLVLGFFMNNVLPARAGEIVRAHLGSKITGKSRALVLATIASERLIDAITISLFFLIIARGLGDSRLSENLTLVCLGFFCAGLGALALLRARAFAHRTAVKMLNKFPRKELRYLSERFFHFLDGLSPLVDLKLLPKLGLWSLVIWTVELCTYKTISLAYGVDLSWGVTVLFFVVANFASLIPAAPGGIGVIEAFGTLALVSTGLPKEQALSIVLTMHLIQYVVVGIPGVAFLMTWRKTIKEIDKEIQVEGEQSRL